MRNTSIEEPGEPAGGVVAVTRALSLMEAFAVGESSLSLAELSRRAGFEYEIYLLVPAHDIMRDTYRDTLATLQSVAPKPKLAIPTAELFLDSPAQYYYAFDGHLNPKGSKRIADFLISRDKNKTN